MKKALGNQNKSLQKTVGTNHNKTKTSDRSLGPDQEGTSDRKLGTRIRLVQNSSDQKKICLLEDSGPESTQAKERWERKILWSPSISHITTQSHWSSGSTVCFTPRGRGLHPGDPTGTGIFLVTPAWSLIIGHDRSSLLVVFITTLATGCFSHPSYTSSILTAGHRLWRNTARIL
jgi:hypothetical protein